MEFRLTPDRGILGLQMKHLAAGGQDLERIVGEFDTLFGIFFAKPIGVKCLGIEFGDGDIQFKLALLVETAIYYQQITYLYLFVDFKDIHIAKGVLGSP